MPYSHEDHPFKLKHGFVAWATALLLVMFGYNTVIPLFQAVDASVAQQSIQAPPPTETVITEENNLVDPEKTIPENQISEENANILKEVTDSEKVVVPPPTIAP